MYPRIRVEKRHADGTPRAVWQAYRIEDRDGAVRLWTPSGTPRIHVNGRWTPDSAFVLAWKSGDPFVVSYYEDAEGHGLYIDIVREVIVGSDRFVYVDLYVDVLYDRGRVSTKDEHLLGRLRADEADRVLVVRDELVRRVTAGEPPFRLGDARWQIEPAARALGPGAELAL